MSRTVAKIADAVLESTIVGSFTKVGYSARERIFGWSDDLPRLDDQIVVITGATTGIGKATAIGLAELGAEVHLTSRSQDRADATAEELNGMGFTGSATGHQLDTGDFESVLQFANEIRRLGKVDVLIHNAGALTAEFATDEQGRELTLSTHLIGPYLLTKELRPKLNEGARVLFMSSGGMYSQQLDVANIELTEDNYRGAIAYARAKRGQVELVAHLGPKWAPSVIMHAMHPGWVDTPGVDAGLPGFGKVMGPLLRDPHQGADTMIWLAATGGYGKPGRFWLDRKPRGTVYLPWTAAGNEERKALIDWLELHTLPGTVAS